MKRMILAVMALAIITTIGVLDVSGTSDVDKGNPVMGADEPLLKTMQSSLQKNETDVGQMTLKYWNNYAENVDYSLIILNESIRGNLTHREAMVLMSTLLVLNSNAMADLAALKPGEKYADFQGYTLKAMAYFNKYLENMAKFYETEDTGYALDARDIFKMGQEYSNKGKEEAEFLF